MHHNEPMDFKYRWLPLLLTVTILVSSAAVVVSIGLFLYSCIYLR